MSDSDATIRSLVEIAHRIGADRRLVLHGGGNISAKVIEPDHLGRERTTLVIKASGADLRTIEDGGFARLYLDDLLTLRERDLMSDDEMTAFQMRTLVDPSSPRPSIETLLHAFRPARFVFHVHADAICTLTNTPKARDAVSEALGADLPLLAYVRPGFALAKQVAEISGDAVVLAHHGLVTWADDAKTGVQRMLDLVERAERYLKSSTRPHARPIPATPTAGNAEVEGVLLSLRRRLSRRHRKVLAFEPHGRDIADRSDVARIATAGPATADHLLRTRPWTAVVTDRAKIDAIVDAVEARYDAFVTRHTDRVPNGVALRDPTPSVVLVPGMGLVTSGSDARAARATAEVAMHTHGVAADVLDVFGEVQELTESELFDIEYWPLELAKLKPSIAADLAARVIVVTGAGSGIGRETALALARAGAHVCVGDRDPVGLDETAESLRALGADFVAVTGDLTDATVTDRIVHETVLGFGGIDGVVFNVGVAVTGRLAELSPQDWAKSLAINTTSHFLLVRRLLPVLETQALGGSLVFVASKNAFSPGEGFGAYSVAKAAEVQLARMVAIEAGRFGVRANVVSPDAVFEGSKLWDKDLRTERAAAHGVELDQLERFYAERSILGWPVRSSDVADAIAFCLSDRSSRMTGCVITVDSGVAAAFPR